MNESLVFCLLTSCSAEAKHKPCQADFFHNVQLENMYQLDYEIAVNIA